MWGSGNLWDLDEPRRRAIYDTREASTDHPGAWEGVQRANWRHLQVQYRQHNH